MFCVHIFLPNLPPDVGLKGGGATLSAGSVCGCSVDPPHQRPPSQSDFNHFLLVQAIVFLIPDTWADASGKLRRGVAWRGVVWRARARSRVLFLGSMSGMEIRSVRWIRPLQLRLIQAAQNRSDVVGTVYFVCYFISPFKIWPGSAGLPAPGLLASC